MNATDGCKHTAWIEVNIFFNVTEIFPPKKLDLMLVLPNIYNNQTEDYAKYL